MKVLTRSKVASVQWGSQNHWNVVFPNRGANEKVAPLPSPFDDWFPATDVTLNDVSLNTTTLMLGKSEFKLPQSGSASDLTLTVVDTQDEKMYRWYEAWVDYIKGGDTVKTLEESYKLVQIESYSKTGSAKSGLSHSIESRWKSNGIRTYMIVPTGQISWTRGSSAETVSLSLTFDIVGIVR